MAVGRTNWLFVDSRLGGESDASLDPLMPDRRAGEHPEPDNRLARERQSPRRLPPSDEAVRTSIW